MAIFGVLTHMAVYAYREGRKEQRLLAVEKRVENMPAIEVMLASVTASLGGVKEQIAALTSDLKRDIGEIRNHLMRERG